MKPSQSFAQSFAETAAAEAPKAMGSFFESLARAAAATVARLKAPEEQKVGLLATRARRCPCRIGNVLPRFLSTDRLTEPLRKIGAKRTLRLR